MNVHLKFAAWYMELILNSFLKTEPELMMRRKFTSGPGSSKLTTSLVNVLLKFQMLTSQIHIYFLLKKCEKLLQLLSFLQQKISVYLVMKS